MQETRVRASGQEDSLEKGMATLTSILVREIPWTEQPGGLQSMGLQRAGHDWGLVRSSSGIQKTWVQEVNPMWTQMSSKLQHLAEVNTDSLWGPHLHLRPCRLHTDKAQRQSESKIMKNMKKHISWVRVRRNNKSWLRPPRILNIGMDNTEHKITRYKMLMK